MFGQFRECLIFLHTERYQGGSLSFFLSFLNLVPRALCLLHIRIATKVTFVVISHIKTTKSSGDEVEVSLFPSYWVSLHSDRLDGMMISSWSVTSLSSNIGFFIISLPSQAASERCYVNIGVLRFCFLIYIFRNFWPKSLKNTCEEVHFLLSCRL